MKNVAITGVAGYLGNILMKRIAQEKEVEHIIGPDIKKPEIDDPKLTFIKHDVRQPFGDIIAQNKIDTAIHFAFIVPPAPASPHMMHDININGSKNFLDSVKQAKVQQIFYMGSNTGYGAHKDNPKIITEDTPLHPNKDFPYPVYKAQVDHMFQDFAKQNPDTIVTIGRTVPVTGPHGEKCGLTVLFLPIMVKAMGYDPLWQFVHEDDLMDAIVILLKQRKAGQFNFTGDGGLTYSQMCKALGKPTITLPFPLLYWGTRLSWTLRLQKKSQAGGAHLLRYPIVLSGEKLKKETGFQYKYTGPEAFNIFMKAMGKKPIT